MCTPEVLQKRWFTIKYKEVCILHVATGLQTGVQVRSCSVYVYHVPYYLTLSLQTTITLYINYISTYISTWRTIGLYTTSECHLHANSTHTR